jgi:DNA repair exonuclease SbcCD ATPase subunit
VEQQIDSARSALETKREQVSRAMEAGREAAQQARGDLERRLAETKAAYNAGADVARSSRSSAAVRPDARNGSDV